MEHSAVHPFDSVHVFRCLTCLLPSLLGKTGHRQAQGNEVAPRDGQQRSRCERVLLRRSEEHGGSLGGGEEDGVYIPRPLRRQRFAVPRAGAAIDQLFPERPARQQPGARSGWVCVKAMMRRRRCPSEVELASMQRTR